MSKNKKGPIISAVIGATFFAIPYVGMGLTLIPSLGFGIAAFCAGNLLFSEHEEKEIVDPTKSFYEMLLESKKQNAQIYSLISKIENSKLQNDLTEIHDTAGKIIDTISKNPNKLNQAQSFFDYYLPVTLKILRKYDLIENQSLEDEEIKKFMKSTEVMLEKVKKSFKSQLANLYQSDIIDTDAEIKVFETMLNSEGLSDINDFDIIQKEE